MFYSVGFDICNFFPFYTSPLHSVPKLYDPCWSACVSPTNLWAEFLSMKLCLVHHCVSFNQITISQIFAEEMSELGR